MLIKAMTGLVASGLLLVGQSAQATDWHKKKYYADGGYDYARVVDVDPIVHRVRVTTPRRECWTETRYEVTEYRSGGGHDRAAGPMILGGIIGAAVGNQIGRGDGRRAATVAGAIIGSAVGHDAAARRGPPDRYYTEERPYDVERCDVRYDETFEERIDGYHVTYIYNGRKFTTRMPYDPGDRIRVRVDVHPAEYRH